MAQQIIDIGALPNDGTGDPIRVAYDKTNNNFTELYGGLVYLQYTSIVGANYIATEDDRVIAIDPDGSNRTITLPSTFDTGKVFTIKKTTSLNTISILTDDPSCTIDGAGSYTLTNLESITVILGTAGPDSVYYIIGKVT